jgi:Uma2 family endonuclease
MKNGTGTVEAPETAAPPRPEEPLYEIVNGERVELPPMSIYASRIAFQLGIRLETHAEAHRQGMAVTEAMFILDPVKDLRRRPDVAFVSAATWPLDRPLPESGDWQVIPDLAVEVVSPNDLFEDLLGKMREYFQYGTKQVWIVSPASQQIYVYESPTLPRILTADQELDGGTILPGFRLPVGWLFQPQTQAASPIA